MRISGLALLYAFNGYWEEEESGMHFSMLWLGYESQCYSLNRYIGPTNRFLIVQCWFRLRLFRDWLSKIYDSIFVQLYKNGLRCHTQALDFLHQGPSVGPLFFLRVALTRTTTNIPPTASLCCVRVGVCAVLPVKLNLCNYNKGKAIGHHFDWQ